MSINIRLKVKFRAFFMDLAKFDVAWAVSPSGATQITPGSEPETSRILWNKNGVRLAVWL